MNRELKPSKLVWIVPLLLVAVLVLVAFEIGRASVPETENPIIGTRNDVCRNMGGEATTLKSGPKIWWSCDIMIDTRSISGHRTEVTPDPSMIIYSSKICKTDVWGNTYACEWKPMINSPLSK